MKLLENDSADVLCPEAAQELISMGFADQEYRKKLMNGKEEWDPAIDFANSKKLKEIVSSIGWPTISKVGMLANNFAWLIIQHSKDSDFQHEALEAMKIAAESQDNPLKQIAYLEDRIMCIASNQQKYGTQFQMVPDGPPTLVKIIDPENVNARRLKMDLPPLPKKFDAQII
jgi:hypothetical protein